jgi:thiamine kinase-like enzyme
MPPGDLERLCLAVVPGTGAVEIQSLASGLMSATYKVVRDGAAYALKTGAERGAEFGAACGLGIAWEARLQESAARAKLAPPPVYVDPQHAVLLSQWMPGRPWLVEDVKQPRNMVRIANLLRRVHALPVPASPCVMNPRAWVSLYGAALSRQGVRISDAPLKSAADERMRELAELPPAPGVLCHSDLHLQNLLEDGETLVLLDWEYAHVADAFWDLAGWAANNDFDPQSQRDLLRSYLGGAPSAADCGRLRLLMWLYDYVCLLWIGLYLNTRPAGAKALAQRATLLDARLRLPAHYAAHADA